MWKMRSSVTLLVFTLQVMGGCFRFVEAYCHNGEFVLDPHAELTTIFYPHVQIPTDYEINELPNEKCSKEPFSLNMSINLADIVSINEKQHMITLETTLGLSWYDKRIKVNIPEDHPSELDYVMINRNPVGNLWFPDIFLDHAQKVRRPAFNIPTSFLRIYNDSRLYFSSRVNYDLVCHMSFEDYPADTQICDVLFESWGFTNDRVRYRWDIANSNVNENIRLNQHTYSYKFDTYVGGYKSGDYPGVMLRLVLKRSLSYHLLRTYLPSTLFVTLSWFSMFVPLNHVPGRVGMGMTSLLTQATMFGSLTSKTPPVSYTTKLDVWFVSCITFAFCTLTEFTIEIIYKYYWHRIPRIAFLKEKSDKPKMTPQERAIYADSVILHIQLWGIALLLCSFIIFNIFYWCDMYFTYTRPVAFYQNETNN